MKRDAMGVQARAVLREPARALRLVTDVNVPAAVTPQPMPGPALALGSPEAVRRTEVAVLRAGLAERDARIADLEGENRALRRAVDAARAEGERAERARHVRTMSGRLPSILTR